MDLTITYCLHLLTSQMFVRFIIKPHFAFFFVCSEVLLQSKKAAWTQQHVVWLKISTESFGCKNNISPSFLCLRILFFHTNVLSCCSQEISLTHTHFCTMTGATSDRCMLPLSLLAHTLSAEFVSV